MPPRPYIDAQGNVVYNGRDVEAGESYSIREMVPSCSCFSCLANISKVFWSMVLAFVGLSVGGAFVQNKYMTAAIVIMGWLISLAMHEYGHAITAFQGGDYTIQEKEGYLSLDITKYAEPMMTFLVPCLLLLFGGVALPGAAVSVQKSNLRSARWETGVALAGPAMNLVFGFGVAMTCHLYTWIVGLPAALPTSLGPALSFLAYTQVMATVLNLIPLPPLDGWGALSPWLPSNCFMKRWAENPWHYKSMCLVTFLVIYAGVRMIPGVAPLMQFLTSSVYILDPALLSRGAGDFTGAFSLSGIF